jgi:hypothetical protein
MSRASYHRAALEAYNDGAEVPAMNRSAVLMLACSIAAVNAAGPVPCDFIEEKRRARFAVFLTRRAG